MSLSFEVRDSDLLARIGRLSINRRNLETPCLLPVIHPVNQLIPASEIGTLGFGGVMTNSYIFRRRLRREVVAKGVHSMLGFDGIVMTDSGGYQVLEYGDLNITYDEIAEFQSQIGSDFAVTLDRPTGFSASRIHARSTMEYSLKNAVETINMGLGDRTCWVGPVQGGLFLDLLATSTRKLLEAGFTFLALGSPTQLMENYLFADLVKMIAAVRKHMPYAVPLHLFGAGHPLTMALSVALGCDTFDSASYILFAKEGRYMTSSGVLELRRMQYLPCSCPECNSTSAKELAEMNEEERVRMVATHNLRVLREELLVCKQAIVEGRIWELVRQKAGAHPSVLRAFREMVKQKELLRMGTPFIKDRGLLMSEGEDLLRPELSVARERLAGAMGRDSDAALILAKGIPTRGHSSKRLLTTPGGKQPDIYKLHRQIGPYPAELEFIYPFGQTVHLDDKVPAALLSSSVRQLKRMGYRRVELVAANAGRRFHPRNTRRKKDSSLSPR